MNPCIYGNPKAPRTAVLFGDSIGVQWFSAFESQYAGNGWRLILLTKSSCPIVDRTVFNERIKAVFVVCDEWRKNALNYLVELRPDIVFIGSSAAYSFAEEEWEEGTTDVLDFLSVAAEKVFIIRATPRIGLDSDWDRIPLIAFKNAAAKFDNVEILDFNDIVCPSACRAESFRDDLHLTDSFVRSIASQIREKL